MFVYGFSTVSSLYGSLSIPAEYKLMTNAYQVLTAASNQPHVPAADTKTSSEGKLSPIGNYSVVARH